MSKKYTPMYKESDMRLNVDVGICQSRLSGADLVVTLYTKDGESIDEINLPILYCPICGKNLQKLQPL